MTWYPKNVIVAIVLLATFAVMLNAAIDYRTGALVGVLALVAYLALDGVLTFNPGQLWRRSRR